MIPISAITDEFSPDFDTALEAMSAVGMTGAELRLISGKNIVELSDDEVGDLRARVEQRGMRVLSIASPVLKCVLPGGPADRSALSAGRVRIRLHVRRSAAAHAARVRGRGEGRRQDHPRLFLLADDGAGAVFRQHRHGPARAGGPGGDARDRDRARERARLQRRHRRGGRADARRGRSPGAEVDLGPGQRLDPRRDRRFRTGTRACRPRASCTCTRKTAACAITSRRGDRSARWTSTGRGRLPRSSATATRGSISLETHWRGTDGDRLQASIICGENLQKLVAN